jgi:hypothetical protein
MFWLGFFHGCCAGFIGGMFFGVWMYWWSRRGEKVTAKCNALFDIPQWDIHCQLELGHAGEHRAKDKGLKLTWWNQEANPQIHPHSLTGSVQPDAKIT